MASPNEALKATSQAPEMRMSPHGGVPLLAWGVKTRDPTRDAANSVALYFAANRLGAVEANTPTLKRQKMRIPLKMTGVSD